ncbi:MAG: 4-(cytidine 5'-diphospho)-2-C-methyl-D-erythritol kinase [Pirellulales bacterium]|nr:4-(cytidine 5'-diphospho)-2-C-methyl-D-erythritol kinase [Pirellulales bacterium]
MYARKAGTVWEVLAPAKLNLYLDVLGRRPDGFHELETLMAPVRLYDRLQWRAAEAGDDSEFQLDVQAATRMPQHVIPADRRNLVWKAAELLAREAGIAPHGAVTLSKRIPAQAGLGGGSSDAAAALVLLSAAWGFDYPAARLQRLAAELGSDVPFFLAGSTAICRGRGEIVVPVSGIPRLEVVIAVPSEGVATSAAFAALDAPLVAERPAREGDSALASLIARLRRGARASAGRRMFNSLQRVAELLCPAIRRIGTSFASVGCCAHILTGSGSAYFGLMHSARQARRVAALLSSLNLGTIYATATCR